MPQTKRLSPWPVLLSQGILLAWISLSQARSEDTPDEIPIPEGEVTPIEKFPENVPPPAENAPAPAPLIEPDPAAPEPDLHSIAEGNCVIAGEVSDSISLDPVANVIVTINGTNRSVETDANGKFHIEGLPAGDFVLESFKLGYFNEVTHVTVIASEPAAPRISLRAKPSGEGDDEFTLEEETVIGEYQESSNGDLLLDLELGPNIVAGITKEQFTQMGINDAAGAVSKIAGANIVGGKYAVIRGLGDRYSNTLVNGALISSADPSKKAVQLDLFPTDLLQNVAIIKTATPDLPAEFAGGMVLLETLRLPEERIIKFKLGVGSNSNLDGDFYVDPGNAFNYFGKPSVDIPLAPLPGGLMSTGYTGSRAPATDEELAAAAVGAAQMEQLHSSAGMRPEKRDPKQKYSYDITLGDSYEFENGIRVGGVGSFTYESGDRALKDIQIGRTLNLGSDAKPGSDGTPDSEDYATRTQTEDRYTEYVNWGALAAVGVEFGENHQIGATWFKNYNSESEVTLGRNVREVGGEFPEYLSSGSNPFGAGAYTYQAFDQIQPVQRDLELLQFDGSHMIGTDAYSFKLDWLLSRSTALEDRPQTRTLFFSQLDFADPRIATVQQDVYQPQLGTVYTAADVYNSSPPLVTSYRESLSTDEDAGNERIDLTFPVWKEDEDNFFDLKLGGNHFKRTREVRGRFFDYSISNTLNGSLLADEGEYGVAYLQGFDSNLAPDGTARFNGWTGPQAASQNGSLILTESTLLGRTVRNVDAGNEIDALYLMGSLSYGPWGAIGGVRQESESRYYQVLPGLNAFAFVNESPVFTDNDYLLPSFSIWRTFGDDDQFKATLAFSQTIARPTFYEYAPVEIQDQASGDIVIGNPDLIDTEINNFDLDLAWLPFDGTELNLGLFYKDMTSPIAQAYEGRKKTWVNGESGTIKGVELTAFQQLGGGFDISGNYTYIDSLLSYTQQINSFGDSQLIDTSFEGQPSHIVNFMLGYEFEPWDIRANLVYNLTGSYLTGVPATADSSAIVREAYSLLDLVIIKKFSTTHCDGNVKLIVGNILDSEDRQVFEDTDITYQSFSPGRGVSLSAEFNF